MNATEPIGSAPKLDLAAIRTKLNGVRGQDYWRSLEEIAETKEFRDMLHREFPAGASEWWDGLSRRNFLKMSAATMALAGLNACTKQPTREIYPYVKQPEGMVLGEPLYYATSMLLGGFATGVLAKSREGHPIKIDGNPEHPASLGGSSVWMQTSILNLYDPDRSQTVTHNGDISTWDLFLSDLNNLLAENRADRGQGMQFLTETVTSPTLAAQLNGLLKQFPAAKWRQYDPITRDNIRDGARLAFGQFVETHYEFDKASVILSLDSDFLYTHPQRLRYTRHFVDGRRISAGKKEMSRLYVVESTPTVTGTMADHRLPMESGAIENFARLLAQNIRVVPQSATVPLSPAANQFLNALVKDLRQHHSRSIVIAGEWQPPIVHALAHLLNDLLGNSGNTVFYTESAEANPVNQLQSLRELVGEMKAGQVKTLFILGGNPVYSAPADLEFGKYLANIPRSIHLGLDQDETAALCTWHIPQTHYLESWGDARAFDGTVSLMQPLIAPLYDGKAACELLGAMNHQQPIQSDYEIVRAYWQSQNPWPDFEVGWRQAIHDGFIAGTRAAAIQTRVKEGFDDLAQKPSRPGELEICFRPDPSLWDGQFANNGWLQECPKPANKLTWDNAVLISPSLAERLKLSVNDVVDVGFQGRTVRGPVWVMPGQAPNSITLHLGYGRTRVGRIGADVGFNAYQIRTSKFLWFGSGATIVATGKSHLLVATQTHFQLESPERQIYRSTSLAEFRAHSDTIQKSVEAPETAETLYYPAEYPYQGYKWGMSIDLTACVGCNACLVACEVENNIPVVGKEQVHKAREMHWLRVDTYYKGPLDNPQFNHAPVPCMQCEHAPCELVCPVEATVHDSEGLNAQIYQRCVGTRFCSNNCPYKVRRFNFLQYTDYHTPNFKPMNNPEVTVRWRGVMEKCTYCVQRIASARITAEKENRRIREGEVRTACQQACPAQAIVFGDLNTAGSKVAELKGQSLDYSMLGELNTRPRTTYLAKVTNPNLEIATQD
ncbi:MAG TPA: TAT-variant-translocated molybdopterin oxidoreductase [Verrucomicrobiae bacterium]|nr:TAT-variant-translocated molybdopterin oxidoreductase [Verrucomicrobiae bacterium]